MCQNVFWSDVIHFPWPRQKPGGAIQPENTVHTVKHGGGGITVRFTLCLVVASLTNPLITPLTSSGKLSEFRVAAVPCILSPFLSPKP